ncbi:hypothetical protein GCM10028775_76460 [Catellatospora paridis]
MKTGQCVRHGHAQGHRKTSFEGVVLTKAVRFPNELYDKDVFDRVISKEPWKTATKRVPANIGSEDPVDRRFVSEVRGPVCVSSLLQE